MIRNLIILCFIMACNSTHEKPKNKSLECVLDVYMSEYFIEECSEIFISDMKGWTDSTSIIRVLTICRNEIAPGKIYFAKYKGIKIYMEYGELKDNKITHQFEKTNFSMPDNLKWQLIEIDNSPSSKLPPPEEFDELQFICNPYKRCISEVIMGEENLVQKIESTCSLCK